MNWNVASETISGFLGFIPHRSNSWSGNTEIGKPVGATGKVQAGQSFIQNDTELSFFIFYLILKKMKLYECQKLFEI